MKVEEKGRNQAEPAQDLKKKLQVAFYVYPSAFQSPGGGEVQLLKTKEYLEREGIAVKLFDQWNDKLAWYNVFHTFGSVKECLYLMRIAKVLGVKGVLSTICWYSWKAAWWTYPSLRGRTISMARQMAKVVLPFLPTMRREMMQLSDLLFPNSESEARQLIRYFGMPREKIFIVPNGVDADFEQAEPDAFVNRYGLRDFILIVGRIEPRKNQLNMIRALKGIKIPVVVIGEPVHPYEAYYEACRREAESNVHFIGVFPHHSELLASAYAACNTFLLASWLETPGLAALEAALAGAKVVITPEGATREYFLDYASYAAPHRLSEIRAVTLKTYENPKDGRLKEHIRKNYLWDRVAQRTLEGYQRLLGDSSHG